MMREETLNILFILLAISTTTLRIARGEEEKQEACRELNEIGNILDEEECMNGTQEARYYYDSNARTCNSILTCNSTLLDSLHRSIDECRSLCSPCPALKPTSHSSVIFSTCTQSSIDCEAVYRCENDYFFFTGNKRTCRNGVWSDEPICAKPVIYYKEKELDKHAVIYLNDSKTVSTETVECRVQPKLPKNTIVRWTTQSRHVINGTWSETGYQLSILSNGSFPTEYFCNISTLIDGNVKSFHASVIFNVNTTANTKPPEILYSLAYYNPATSVIKGECFCKGYPKPSVSWYIDDIELAGNAIDLTETSEDKTFSVLQIRTNQQSGGYKCSCSNGKETIESIEHYVSVPGSTTSRRKRSSSKEEELEICSMIKSSTVTITGTVKRQLSSSSILHVKQDNLIYSRPRVPSLPKVLRVTSSQSNAKSNKTYLMLLDGTKEGGYNLALKLPYSKELVESVIQLCQL
ncbi:PREDICTED: uncharacterized protein LOC109593758 [Amphimedon queenslandica]|uniref:Ig-like domain-containing protein n=1 Tax=Amphimedon queenslandica TaxID=400682 RepID=A0A1X7VKU5_AMPQE|nr:PREDICTED: uncharacterized protein LOC109593758 [Amphimedon queenslandica]|eukprot:XP_019864376.1 PREDICTED: uncharacterized protein LOC109593758 [Amphimedon queenslandica]